MFNLLPESEKKILRKEYSRRRALVFLGLLVALIGIAVVFLVPTYVLSHVKRNSVEQEHDAAAKEYASHSALPVAEIQHIQDLLILIGDGQATASSSLIIKTITDARGAGIKMNSLSISWSDKSTVQIQGISSTREALRSFTNTLQSTKMFDNVNVPVSAYAKDSDIPFSITMGIHQNPKKP